MIKTIFSFLGAILGLAEHSINNIIKKYNDSAPHVKTKLTRATEHVRKKYGHS